MTNSGLFLRGDRKGGDPAYSGCEVQILDDFDYERVMSTKLKEWQYPSDWVAHRLGGAGQLSYGGKRWEISGALKNQLVGLQVQGERVLVYYCNMPVRELDLRRGSSMPLPGNPFRQLVEAFKA